MSLEPMTPEDVRRQVKQRLRNGWVLLMGDPETINVVEQECYPPNTPKNSDFVLIMSLMPVPHAIIIAKKTEALREWMNNPPDWERTLALVLPDVDEMVDVGNGIKQGAVQQIYHDGDIDKAIEDLFADSEVSL